MRAAGSGDLPDQLGAQRAGEVGAGFRGHDEGARSGDDGGFVGLAQAGAVAAMEDVAYFEKKGRPREGRNSAVYAAMVRSVDESVGRIMARLDEETEGRFVREESEEETT